MNEPHTWPRPVGSGTARETNPTTHPNQQETTMTTTALDLDQLHLDNGSHDSRTAGVCVMEAVAWFAGEPHTDRPQCASPVLTGFAMNLNDRWDDVARQRLVSFVPRLAGTRDGRDEARSYLALDWLIRTYTPAWLDLAGLSESAQELRGLRRIVDMSAAEAAGPVVRSAQAKSAAAGAAAGAAARDAAGDAAGAAAWDAAGDAAGAAAWDAAWDAAGAAARAAAWNAARAAARDAARAVLRPTVEQLQMSALDLLDRMIDAQAAS
jgi:hypothetical protein